MPYKTIKNAKITVFTKLFPAEISLKRVKNESKKGLKMPKKGKKVIKKVKKVMLMVPNLHSINIKINKFYKKESLSSQKWKKKQKLWKKIANLFEGNMPYKNSEKKIKKRRSVVICPGEKNAKNTIYDMPRPPLFGVFSIWGYSSAFAI